MWTCATMCKTNSTEDYITRMWQTQKLEDNRMWRTTDYGRLHKCAMQDVQEVHYTVYCTITRQTALAAETWRPGIISCHQRTSSAMRRGARAVLHARRPRPRPPLPGPPANEMIHVIRHTILVCKLHNCVQCTWSVLVVCMVKGSE